MRKLLMMFLILLGFFMLVGCTNLLDEDGDPIQPQRNEISGECGGRANYFLIEGECIFLEDFISKNITVSKDVTRVENLDSFALMNEFVADLTGSKGLAVVSRQFYESIIELKQSDGSSILKLSTTQTNEDTENLIVKLREDGVFEELKFTNEHGQNVEVTSNPLALEVYGAYTVVIFEITYSNQQPSQNFAQKVYDSFYAGGVYLIHNESGKMFSTKDVDQIENVYHYEENHSRNVRLTVKINEPVVEKQWIQQFDEFNMPILDALGNAVYQEISVPVLDIGGNPLIFTEGPILTEEKMVGLVRYFEQQLVDDDGNPMVDENNNPIFEIVEEPVLDQNGNQVFELQTVLVLDELGNVQYQQEFEVDFYIEDIRFITVINYSSIVVDNPITRIAQRFVDKIISEYFNWNYYRINNYMISSYGFSAGSDAIYFLDQFFENSVSENFVMKLSFDALTNELTLEKYINATKANFVNCEIILDPRNNNIICKSWQGGNIKIYSESHGLSTIPDSDELQPVTFPNGELYFYNHNQIYVEELGYYTTLLYTINSDGTLNSHYIELGEKDEVVMDAGWHYYTTIDLYRGELEPYATNHHLSLQSSVGNKIIAKGDLLVSNIAPFSSFRPDCENTNGCWYNMQTDILDELGNVVVTLDFYGMYYPGDPAPNYKETYQIDANTIYKYEKVYSNIDELCDKEDGCVSQVNMVDPSINQWGAWMYQNVIFPFGGKILNTISINEENSAVYEYTKDVFGVVCNYDTCEEYIKVKIYDDSGNLLSESHRQMQIPKDEIIPLYIEYHITLDTIVTMTPTVCNTSTGCWRNYETFDQHYFGISYQAGDTMYETITFAETDKQTINEETLISETCNDLNGCYTNEESIYIIVDEFGAELYRFSQYMWIEYGYRKPYVVTIDIADTTLNYRKESLLENRVCNTASCYTWVAFTTDSSEYASLGYANVRFENGEEIYNQVILPGATPISFIDELMCNSDEGCVIYIDNYKVVDTEGVEYAMQEGWWVPSLPVYFAKGEKIPVDYNIEVTFQLTNLVYRKVRINVYDFIYNLNNVVILDENVYLIEKQSWVQGNDNFILIYDEVEGKYYAKYTNISAFTEITKFKEGYIAINDDETAIINFTFNDIKSTSGYYYFDVIDLTTGLKINGVNALVVDYDGSIYFKGVDNFINDITGSILEDGTVIIDTQIVERDVIRLRPIN